MADVDSQLERCRRDVERERMARVDAERRLEAKAAELRGANRTLEAEIERRTAELVRARDEAIAAGRARTDFLARMSHEIRTPMNAVIGMSELLLMEPLDPSIAGGIRTIRSAADALLSLINDILDFSKIEAGVLSLQALDFDLDAQVSSIIELMAAPARKAGIELRVHMDPRTAGVMHGDEVRLRQVLLNLVGNAVKFTEEGFVELRTRVLRERGGEVEIEFCVADSGPGIEEASREKIFEVFEQGDGSSTRRYGGTGLGLPISRRLVELFGGRLWVQSELGRGSRFYFTAWLRRVAAAAHAPIPAWKVLLLDEDADTLGALREVLRPAGGVVIGVADGFAAVCQLVNAVSGGHGFDVLMFPSSEAARSSVLSTIEALPELSSLRVVSFGDHVEEATLSIAAQLSPQSAAGALRSLADEDAKVSTTTDASAKASRSASILLVDDNPANRAITARLLEKAGHSVQTARDGREALSAVTAGEFDLVFMDVQMPGLDGVEATERIRGWESTTGRAVPIVGLSAITAPEERRRCRRAGMDDFLLKPIRAASLFEMVEQVLASSETRQEQAAARATLAERLAAPEVREAFGDDDESVRLCLEVFAASRPERSKALTDALEGADQTTMRQLAHTLAGSFMGLVRPELIDRAKGLQHAGEGELAERATALIEFLDGLDREVRAFLELT